MMERTIEFSRQFSARMFWLAVIIGLITAIALPCTYMAMSYRDRELYATLRGELLAYNIQQAIQDNPELWIFDIPRFIEIAHHLPQAELVSRIRVFDRTGALAYEQKYNEVSPFAITTRTPIKYLGQTDGWLELVENMDSLYMAAALITAFFGLLGLTFFLLIYKYPQGIIKKAENKALSTVEQLQASQKILRELAIRDPKTRLFNASYLQQRLEEEIETLERSGGTLWVLILDIDNFKKIKDTFGRMSGDTILLEVAALLLDNTHSGDTLGRFDGEVFMLIMPGGETERAKKHAQRLRSMAEMHEFGGKKGRCAEGITLSIGMAEWRAGVKAEQLIDEADTARQAAVEAGRNRVCIFSVLGRIR